MITKQSTILITGAAGFIASCMASYLYKRGFTSLVLVDDFSIENKRSNYVGIQSERKIERSELYNYFASKPKIDCIIHFGARTDTTEMDYAIHEELNLRYSKMVWTFCAEQQIPILYASSAATYGDGALGYDDSHAIISSLLPLNPYGVSKNEFDKWVLQQIEQEEIIPPYWYGLKFFNVYGPNEYHKGRMASVIFHAYHQIQQTGTLKLFQSHRADYAHGEQRRDFIYVMDVIEICNWLMQHMPQNGIYNVGTGNASSFNELAKCIFKAMYLPIQITYIETPMDIRDTYQYFTEANMNKLRSQGYTKPFYSIQDGIHDYVQHYLKEVHYF
jgi:ADP-L-glycero-D-manno-heptose 6-epimerase